MTYYRNSSQWPLLGTLPPEKTADAPQLIFNQHLNAWLTLFFVTVLWVIVLNMLRVCDRQLSGKPTPPLSKSPHEPSRLVADWARD